MDHSPELFGRMAEATSDGLAVLDDGVVGWENPALARLAGRGRGELVDRPAVDLFAPAPGPDPLGDQLGDPGSDLGENLEAEEPVLADLDREVDLAVTALRDAAARRA